MKLELLRMLQYLFITVFDHLHLSFSLAKVRKQISSSLVKNEGSRYEYIREADVFYKKSCF